MYYRKNNNNNNNNYYCNIGAKFDFRRAKLQHRLCAIVHALKSTLLIVGCRLRWKRFSEKSKFSTQASSTSCRWLQNPLRKLKRTVRTTSKNLSQRMCSSWFRKRKKVWKELAYLFCTNFSTDPFPAFIDPFPFPRHLPPSVSPTFSWSLFPLPFPIFFFQF